MHAQREPRILLKQPSFNGQQSFVATSENESDILHTLQPTVSYTNLHQKELSLRSISSHKRSRLSAITPRTYDHERTPSMISQSARYNYEAIERILKNQNHNLKKQNELLLNEVQRLKGSNKRYKETCLRQRIQMQALKEECEAQKQRADEMKQIIMTRLIRLEQKAIGGSGQGLTPQEREDLMNALNSSDIQKDQ